jgi:maleylpyruvate isomerase
MLEAAIRGEVIEQYERGDAGRAAEIESGSLRPLDELFIALVDTDRRLEATWARLGAHGWSRPTAARAGLRPAFTCLRARWREVEIHSVDLGSPSQSWPVSFARAGLAVAIDGLELRPLAARLPEDVTVVLVDHDSNRWTSDGQSIPTHIGLGTSQHLLAWIVGRGGDDEIDWTPEAPPISAWP